MFRTVNHIHLQSKHPLFMFTRSPPTRRMDGDAAVLLVPYGQRSGCGGRAVWKYSACDYRRTRQGMMYDRTQSVNPFRLTAKKPLCVRRTSCPAVSECGVSTHSISPAPPRPSLSRILPCLPGGWGAFRPPSKKTAALLTRGWE